MKKLLVAIAAIFTLSAQAQTNTLLDQAFWRNKPDVSQVKAEIEKGNSPSQMNPMSFDPVVMAINTGAPTETIKYLLEQPGNAVDKITHDSRTYLHWAASRGNTEIMEMLIAKGAKATVGDSHGMTPLNFAAAGGQQNTTVYDLCLKAGADLKKDLNHDGANALLVAVANDKELKLTDYFTAKGLDIKSKDAAGRNAFAYAARGGNINVLKALLQRGVPATNDALIMASQGGRGSSANLEVYQYLESLGLKPTATGKDGETVLHAIARRPGQQEIITYFIGKGVDVNKADAEGNTAFMNAAATNRDTATIALLLPQVKNINQANQKGLTALTMAVRSNSPEMVQYLIRKGASVAVVDQSGDNLAAHLVQSYTPRQAADFEAKLKLLQDKGVSLTAPQKNGNTLYHLAAAKNDISLLKKLEPLQIDINAKNKEGLTALHKAAMVSQDDKALKYMLSIGAKKEAKTSFDETAFDLASENESLTKNKVSVNFLK